MSVSGPHPSLMFWLWLPLVLYAKLILLLVVIKAGKYVQYSIELEHVIYFVCVCINLDWIREENWDTEERNSGSSRRHLAACRLLQNAVWLSKTGSSNVKAHGRRVYPWQAVSCGCCRIPQSKTLRKPDCSTVWEGVCVHMSVCVRVFGEGEGESC